MRRDGDPLARRDPATIRATLALLGPLTDLWFKPEVSGLEHVPDGPALAVGTHNGGLLAPDMFTLMVAWWRRFGADAPAYGLMHDQLFRVPVVGAWMSRLGAVPARRGLAQAALARGAKVLVYPGGDLDTFKPYRDRHRVTFGDRKGFVRTAIAAGVPIVPVVSVGAHETLRVLTDGRRLAHALGLHRLLRVEVVPVMLCLPWGLWVGAWETHIPLPSRLRIRVLPPLRFEVPREAANDDAVVTRARDVVAATMQRALDALVAEGGFGVRMRLGLPAVESRHVHPTV